MNILLIIFGKIISFMSRLLNKGNGSTWPGEIALIINPNFLKNLILINPNLKIILIAGTNGKTTTSLMIYEIIKSAGFKVFRNESGANLLNGIASSFIKNSNLNGKVNYDFAIFEIDENNLPISIGNLKPNFVLLLNLFRDQLDRYGEISSIAKKWKEAFLRTENLKLLINADDPLVANIGIELENNNKKTEQNIFYFGLPENLMRDKVLKHGADSIYCPKCGYKLDYEKIAYSHLGKWHCNNCGFSRVKIWSSKLNVKYPLLGLYNKYNTLAALKLSKLLNLEEKAINEGLFKIKPAFGRQEEIILNNKKIKIFLSKNPISFNQSLETIMEFEKNPTILIVLNDKIPDGRDISWIWDVDIERYIKNIKRIIVSGDRVYDMALRIKYADASSDNFENLENAIKFGLNLLEINESLYILPTYSSMLEVRKILTGKKIL